MSPFSLPVRRLILAIGFLAVPTTPPPAPPIRGFSPESLEKERALEERFAKAISTDSLRSYLRTLAARPQSLGSPQGKRNAEWLVARLKGWGLDATIEQFEVLFPTPKERLVELVAPSRFAAKLREPPAAGDAYSAQQKEQLPTYNAYSTDGDVTGPLVYVNYGTPADYEELDRRGISVKGAIVISRYGGAWRGLKPKLAAERGAIGCLIYSDPIDDGYALGDVYPTGPYRPADGVQRGSVVDMPTYPGDPSTPGYGSVPGVKALSLKEITVLTKIPVLPISYGDAEPLLAALGGEVVPSAWRGALPITYKVGPGPAKVHLKVAFNWNRVPLYNVIVKIPGAVSPDEWIVRGNHRDGWVNGATDPLSGMIAVLEELRSLSRLLADGWRPARTIVYAAWDGEEQGLLGSTEWVETHLEELRSKTVIYLNTDANGRGFLSAAGSHSLERVVNEAAREVLDPETGLTVWKRRQLKIIADGPDRLRAEARTRADLRINALGSGSDYTPFLQHAGIASLHLGFGGEGGDGVYHSIYDNFEHFTRFADSGFGYGRALAQTAGLIVLRMANAQVLPYHFVGMAETYATYVEELKTLWSTTRTQALEANQQIDEGVFRAVSDPRLSRRPPKKVEVPPYLNFAPLENAAAVLRESANRYEAVFSKNVSDSVATTANRLLLKVEQALTSDDGLPNRTWYRHQIYAPGYYTGYGVKTMPGIRESIEQAQWAQVDPQIEKVAARLIAAAKLIDQAADALESR